MLGKVMAYDYTLSPPQMKILDEIISLQYIYFQFYHFYMQQTWLDQIWSNHVEFWL